MTHLTAGRQLDQTGTPRDGTGFTYDSESRLSDLLGRLKTPLRSQPITGEWIGTLTTKDETNGEYEAGLIVFAPGNEGPPEHVHPTYEEHFEIVAGEFVFIVDGEEITVGEGEEVLVEPGISHTFRCVSDEPGAAIGTVRPPSQVGDVIDTLFGLAHEGKITDEGGPKFFQGMVMAAELSDDTVFTSPPPAVTKALSAVFAPIARLLGYRAVEPEYVDDAYWTAKVEQPVS